MATAEQKADHVHCPSCHSQLAPGTSISYIGQVTAHPTKLDDHWLNEVDTLLDYSTALFEVATNTDLEERTRDDLILLNHEILAQMSARLTLAKTFQEEQTRRLQNAERSKIKEWVKETAQSFQREDAAAAKGGE